MTVPMQIHGPRATQRSFAQLAVAVMLAAFLYRAALFAADGLTAIRFPWELDYGEGIVWQQMRFMFTSRAYGPIDQFPAIVFHYPPVYHVTTSLIAAALGTDELATGRSIALLSTAAAAIVSGLLAMLLVGQNGGRAGGRLAGAVAGLLIFTYFPVIYWAPLMRVDMLAIALALSGLLIACSAVARPRLIDLAAVLFVAAIYTRQTSIAAPAAAFAVLLFVRPSTALRGIAVCASLGVAALAALTWATDGGFARHILLYNVNRLDFGRLSAISGAVVHNATLIALAGFVLVRRIAALRARYRGLGDLRAAAPPDVAFLVAATYLLFSSLTLVLLAKVGSSINYFLEWGFALGLFAACAIAEAERVRSTELRKILGVVLPMMLATQALLAPRAPFDMQVDGQRARELAQLSRAIAAADKPVISDDMILLVRNDREVLWEPSIFAELASTGAWDERPFVERIRRGEFAFFITAGERGDRRFDERYNPAVAAAMDSAYPVTQRIAGLTVHRPR